MSTITHDAVADVVQSILNKHQPEGYRLEVDKKGIKQEGQWWYVTVTPSRNGVRAYDYAHRLSEIEEQLREEQSLKVLLVPALVDD